MNFLIFALGVNLLTLVNAVNDINFSTILKILQPKQKAENSNVEDSNDPIDAIAIVPGFYLQKPEDLSQSLLDNPKAWPDDAFDIFGSNAIRQRKTDSNSKTKKEDKTEMLLSRQILKAVRKLSNYKKSKGLKRSKVKSKKGRKNPMKRRKVLGRMFRGLKDNVYSRAKKLNRKQPFRANHNSDDAKVLGDLLKNIIDGTKDYHIMQYNEKKKPAYFANVEPSKEREDFLEDFQNIIQNDYPSLEVQRTNTDQQQPMVVIISTAPPHGDEPEMENNAKESMEVFDDDYDRINPFNLQTRRQTADIGGAQDSSSASAGGSGSDDSSYERNPGNPFTVHKNKYKQNWPYNHYMDGDHMNINPFGPQFAHMGPSGPELFFGRKWWYYNQDDFKPMG